jgi:hypothetical protein
MKNIRYVAIGSSRDIAVNQLVVSGYTAKYGLNFGVDIYNIITTSPIEMAIALLGIKLGITNKIILSLIIAFLI